MRYIPSLLLVQIPAMDPDVSQEWKEYKSLYKTDFWPNCKHESSGGSLVTLRTSTGKSSPFTLRYWPSMKWTPSQADLMPVYVLEKKLWNYKFSIFECHAMNFTKRIKHYIITMIIFNNKKKKIKLEEINIHLRERERATYWSYCQSFILSIYDKQGKLAFKSRYKVLF